MVKRLNAHIPDEMHRLLRIALAEDATNFSDWVRKQIADYLVGRKSKGVDTPFSPSKFMNFEDAEKLSRPSFDKVSSGTKLLRKTSMRNAGKAKGRKEPKRRTKRKPGKGE